MGYISASRIPYCIWCESPIINTTSTKSCRFWLSTQADGTYSPRIILKGCKGWSNSHPHEPNKPSWKNLAGSDSRCFLHVRETASRNSSGHQKTFKKKNVFCQSTKHFCPKNLRFSLQKKSTAKQPNPQSITCERLEIKAMIGMKANAETMHEASNRTLCARGIYWSCLWSPIYHFCRHEFVEEMFDWQYTILAICGKVFLNDGIPEQIIPKSDNHRLECVASKSKLCHHIDSIL